MSAERLNEVVVNMGVQARARGTLKPLLEYLTPLLEYATFYTYERGGPDNEAVEVDTYTFSIKVERTADNIVAFVSSSNLETTYRIMSQMVRHLEDASVYRWGFGVQTPGVKCRDNWDFEHIYQVLRDYFKAKPTSITFQDKRVYIEFRRGDTTDVVVMWCGACPPLMPAILHVGASCPCGCTVAPDEKTGYMGVVHLVNSDLPEKKVVADKIVMMLKELQAGLSVFYRLTIDPGRIIGSDGGGAQP